MPDVPRPTNEIKTRGVVRARVRYSECDPMGVVYHGAYVPWLEMGRTELLRDAGVSYAQLEAAGVFLVIVKVEVSYKRPAHYDEVVEVRTEWIGGSRVKIRHRYEVVRAEGALVGGGGGGDGAGGGGDGRITPGRTAAVGDLLATAETLLACVDRTGRPAALPGWLVGEREERI